MMKWRDDDDEKANREEEIMTSLHNIDLYDQELLELKRLANERKTASARHQRVYDIAITKSIADIHEMGHDEGMPEYAINKDVEIALKGGKYRKLYRDPTNESENDIINLDRKKKPSRSKSKRPLSKKSGNKLQEVYGVKGDMGARAGKLLTSVYRGKKTSKAKPKRKVVKKRK